MTNSEDENDTLTFDVNERRKRLEHVRSGHKSRVNYFSNKIKANEYKSLGELESALGRLRMAYTKFDEVQIELEMLGDESNTCRNEFEDEFGPVEAAILNQMETLKAPMITKIQTSSEALQTSVSIKLPQIQLPNFDGNELNWLNFRGIFVELIHSNPNLNEIAKFHYLISCIKDGKAFKWVQPYSITSENYSIAWQNLSDHFNNEIAIQKLHMKEIYDIKKPSENSSASLQNFVDETVKNYNSLKALLVPVESWDLFLMHHLSERLDDQSKVAVIKKTPHKEVLSFDKFIEILRERIKILEAQKSKMPVKFDRQKETFIKPTRVMTMQKINCAFCKENHTLDHCPKFKNNSLSPQERYDVVKKHNLCTNCLRDSHRVSDCRASPCALCPLKHNVLLHFGQKNPTASHVNQSIASKPSNNEVPSTSSSTPSASMNFHSCLESKQTSKLPSQVILATAVVWVSNSCGTRMQCRALLDSGSQANFITRSMCQKLSLKTESVHIKISGINGNTSTVTKRANILIESRTSEFGSTLSCLVKPKISETIPSYPVQWDNSAMPKNFKLADPWFYQPDVIDLLLGAELFSEIVAGGKITRIKNLPFYETVFGHVVMGKTIIDPDSSNLIIDSRKNQILTLSSFENLNEQIQKFWLIENIDESKAQSLEEKSCESHYLKNVVRTESGRYSVALPLKTNIRELGNSSINAAKQFFAMENRLHKNPELFQQYSSFMSEYSNLNHMVEVINPIKPECNLNTNYFMPHHAVIRESSSTTKVRVVFNASSKTMSNLSLNDCMMIGPTIQQDLWSILMRFRKHLFGFTGDIAKMYRQILVQERYQDLQRIWWRESKSTPLKCFKLCTVTYGTASAPYLAIRTLFKLADDEQSNFPNASQILKRDFYVDDVLTGSDTIENATKLKEDLINLLKRGGFDLRKINSNCVNITSTSENNQSELVSILGMKWNTVSDKFHFSFKKDMTKDICTKRFVLSEIAQLFDPLGLCGPIIFKAKSFMQTLWASKIGWDDRLPSQLEEFWSEFKTQLCSINEITIPRCIITSTAKSIELHGFGDASERGYGCIIYIRVVNQNDTVVVNFICSKSRVAPLQTQTIPRLELCASLLLAQVAKRVVSAMAIQFNKIYFWTDSEITLHRIKSDPGRFEIFVANRISKIHDITSPDNWYYVPTSKNPADIISRGLMPLEFVNADFWWTGPSFLNETVLVIPKQPSSVNSSQLDVAKVGILSVGNVVKIDEWCAIKKHSNYHKILRIFGYVNRFIRNCKQKRTIATAVSSKCKSTIIEPLQVNEIDGALKVIIRHIQYFHFASDIQNLRKNKSVPRQSKLLSLAPFLDNEGLIRVGGRLKNSDITFDQKHQLVVPASHSFVKLLVHYEHRRLLHAGPQTVLYSLRQRWWIIQGRNLCRKTISECITCVRTRPQTLNQIMGQLPENRVNQSRPFQNVGVDFCGPFLVTHKIRSNVKIKMYIAVFICFCTKAIHMEIVSELSTSAFLAALRRFVSRRGLCAKIYSDNATNFVGAKSELHDLHRLFMSQIHQNEVLKFCLESNIQWNTIPPRSPHFGGLWEAAVKSAKHHIKRTLGSSSFYFEQLNTLVVQIEGCLNSRPLSPMSDDPNDFEPLTPGHFLIGQPLNSIPDPSLTHLNFNRLTQFQKVQHTLQEFWKRWQTEYLSILQQRRKWTLPKHSPQIGDLVILKEDNVPPFKWPMARIIKLHTGQDGYVRVVTVKTSTGDFKRAITRICPLPTKNETSSSND